MELAQRVHQRVLGDVVRQAAEEHLGREPGARVGAARGQDAFPAGGASAGAAGARVYAA